MDKSIRERCEHQASQEEIATLGPTVARPQTSAELYAEDFPRDAVNSYVLSVRLTYMELVELGSAHANPAAHIRALLRAGRGEEY